jgi:hypothetical protein
LTLLQDLHSTLLLSSTTKANHSFPPQEACENKYSPHSIGNYVRGRRRAPKIQVSPLKRRRRKMKVDPKLGGQWKEKEKVPPLGGQWKVPSLVANGGVKEKKNPFHVFSLSLQPILFKPSIFYL